MGVGLSDSWNTPKKILTWIFVFLYYLYPLSGCDISSCGCYPSSWKHWICKREGNRLIYTERWKILVPPKNCCWASHVGAFGTFTIAGQFSTVENYILYVLMSFKNFNSWIMCFVRCDVKLLEDSLCKRVIVTRDETITKWLDPESAAVSRDALAKVVYSRLFDW